MPSQQTKPKQIKWIMTCVSLKGLSEFNTQYFFMGMVRFESQEYTVQGRMQFFAKLDKIRLFVMTNVFANLHTEEIIDFALRS